jgi:cellobiose epimerase
LEQSLKKEILDKWYPLSVDTAYGGFITTFTHDFKPIGKQNKMIVTQSRHTWVNAKAAQRYPTEVQYLKNAAIGFSFLRNSMWDKSFGGFYSLVSRKGEVVDSTKNAYGNAFAIYALAAYYRTSHDTAALNLAKKAFLWLEKHSHDPQYKGYYQHLDRKGNHILRTAATKSMEETGYKDQNSSIHLLEAFTELYQVWPHPLVKERLSEMLMLIRDTIVHDKGYLTLFFTAEWKPVSFRDSAREVIKMNQNIDHVSFGHDVETAYLMLESSHVLGLHNDSVTLKVAKRMVDHSLQYGWDKSVGGFFDEGYYFKDDDGVTIVKDSKNWWAQAEGLNTLLLMADKFPDDSHNYFDKFEAEWRYIDTYIIDHEYGDWFAGGIDKEPGQKKALKGHQWKATYHQFRSLSNCISTLRHNELSYVE